MKAWLLIFAVCSAAQGHDIITTPITFDREIARIVALHCATCHHEDGRAFSLMTYKDARPWAVAIKEETLTRRMPPWGAVKGFGDFRNDQSLTQEQLDLITSWVDGGVPEGEEKDLPKPPDFSVKSPATEHRHGEVTVSGELKLSHAFKLDGLWPETVPDNSSFRVTAQFPDGSIEPLLWLNGYKAQFGHAFLLRRPMDLPAGTVIRGLAPGAKIILLPVVATPAVEKRPE
jgi:hypothetical protein